MLRLTNYPFLQGDAAMELKLHQDLEELKRISRLSEFADISDRIRMVILRAEEYLIEEIAEILHYCRQTVSYWLKRYTLFGVLFLKDKPRSGRPTRLTTEQEKIIYEEIVQSADINCEEKFKTAREIKLRIFDRFSVDFSLGGIFGMLHRLNLSKLIPRPVHIQNDPEKMKEWLDGLNKNLEEIQTKNKGKAIEIYFEDETRYGQKTIATGFWTKTGSQALYKKQDGFLNSWIFGAINPKNGDHYGMILPKLDAQNMQIFLDSFSKNIAENRHVIMILDGSRAHKNGILLVPKNITLLFLPPYSPELNPIERLWKWIKEKGLAFKTYKDIDEIMKAGVEAWNEVDHKIIMSLCDCSYLD